MSVPGNSYEDRIRREAEHIMRVYRAQKPGLDLVTFHCLATLSSICDPCSALADHIGKLIDEYQASRGAA